MSILLTGAFGFVGTHLSAYLAGRGFEVWALDVANPRERGACAAGDRRGTTPYARVFTWDSLKEIPWPQVDAIVHLAGKAHDTRNTSDAQSYFDVNVGLTQKVLAAWQGGGCGCPSDDTDAPKADADGRATPATPGRRAFILFSSVKAVADSVDGKLTEAAAPDPQTPYGRSKLEAEAVVRAFAASVQPQVRTYVLRPCMIHGPGNKGNLNLLYGVVRKGLPWPLGAFENQRSFASIGNVCAVVEGLLNGTAPAGTYQVADDEAISTNTLIGLLAGVMGRKARILKVPTRLIRGAARLGDLLRLPLNSERLNKLTESYVVSNAKIKRALGWERMPVDTRDGLRLSAKGLTTVRNSKR
jgi:nucleoside-diphosphate-sugar epimerase